MKEITIEVPTTTYKKKVVKIERFSIIPGWIGQNSTCPSCGWGINEDTKPDSCAVVKTKNGIDYFHEDCFYQEKEAVEKLKKEGKK